MEKQQGHLPSLADKVGWKQYRKATSLFLAGTPINDIAVEVGVEPETIAKWLDKAWSPARKQEVEVVAQETLRLNRDRIANTINNVLGLVESQIKHYTEGPMKDAVMAPKDIKVFAETAKTLHGLIDADEALHRKDETMKNRVATANSVQDLIRLLKEVDADGAIDYEAMGGE